MIGLHVSSREEIVAIADIESGSAQVAVLAVPKSGPVRILTHAHSLISLEKESSEHSIGAIGERLGDVCARVLQMLADKKIRVPVHSVYCTIHAPWARTQNLRKRTDFDDETRVKESHIKAAAKDTLSQAGVQNSGGMLEASVIRTWLNGYPVRDPEGKSALSVAIAAVVSDVHPEVRRNAEATLAKSFPVAQIEWRSFSRAMLYVLSRLFQDDENYVAVDLGMDATHVVSVRESMVRGDTVVPIGIRGMLGQIDPSRSVEETLGLIRMLNRGACEGAACETAQKAMATIEPDLAKTLGAALGELAATRRLGNTLVLFAHPDIAEWMERFFSRLDFAQFTATMLPFSVQTFSADLVAQWVSDDTTPAVSAHLLEAALVNTEKHD